MSRKHEDPMDADALEPADEADSLADESSADATMSEAENETAVESEVDALRRKVEELKDRELRAMAEMRNVQQRARREKDEALKFAEASFARELLSVLDGLELAMDAVTRGADTKAIGDGVKIVFDQFKKVLAAHHVEPIDAVGAPFDPSIHEALMQQPSKTDPPGTVMQQLARGYQMHGRVLRAARVIVARAPD